MHSVFVHLFRSAVDTGSENRVCIYGTRHKRHHQGGLAFLHHATRKTTDNFRFPNILVKTHSYKLYNYIRAVKLWRAFNAVNLIFSNASRSLHSTLNILVSNIKAQQQWMGAHCKIMNKCYNNNYLNTFLVHFFRILYKIIFSIRFSLEHFHYKTCSSIKNTIVREIVSDHHYHGLYSSRNENSESRSQFYM